MWQETPLSGPSELGYFETHWARVVLFEGVDQLVYGFRVILASSFSWSACQLRNKTSVVLGAIVVRETGFVLHYFLCLGGAVLALLPCIWLCLCRGGFLRGPERMTAQQRRG